MKARKINTNKPDQKEETTEVRTKEDLRIALQRKLQQLENSQDLFFKSPELIILTPHKANEDLYDSIRIEYAEDGGFAIKGKTKANTELIRKMIANYYSSPNSPLVVFAEFGEGSNLKDVYREKIMKFKPHAMQYFAEQKMSRLRPNEIFDLYWGNFLGVLFYWTGDKDKELREKLQELESIFGEVHLGKPELIIVVPYEFNREEKLYYMAHVSYLKGWADLGYKENKIKQWCRVIKSREMMDVDEVDELLRKYYRSSQEFPPVILGDPVTSPENMDEEVVKSCEAKVLQFRRHAVEYWKKRQI